MRLCWQWREDPSPDYRSPLPRRRRQASKIEEATGLDIQEQGTPPAITDGDHTHRSIKHNRGATGYLLQEDHQAGGGERCRGVRRGQRKLVRRVQREKRKDEINKRRYVTRRYGRNCSRLQQFPRVSSSGSPQITVSSDGTALVASGKARDRLVLPVVGQQPETSGSPQQVRTTRSLRTHGIPQ